MCILLTQWFLTKGNSPLPPLPQGNLAMSGDILYCHHWTRARLVSSGWSPWMLLNSPQRTGQSFTRKNYLVQNANSAEVEKPYSSLFMQLSTNLNCLIRQHLPGAASSSPGKSGGRAEVIRTTGLLLPSPVPPAAPLFCLSSTILVHPMEMPADRKGKRPDLKHKWSQSLA